MYFMDHILSVRTTQLQCSRKVATDSTLVTVQDTLLTKTINKQAARFGQHLLLEKVTVIRLGVHSEGSNWHGGGSMNLLRSHLRKATRASWPMSPLRTKEQT